MHCSFNHLLTRYPMHRVGAMDFDDVRQSMNIENGLYKLLRIATTFVEIRQVRYPTSGLAQGVIHHPRQHPRHGLPRHGHSTKVETESRQKHRIKSKGRGKLPKSKPGPNDANKMDTGEVVLRTSKEKKQNASESNQEPMASRKMPKRAATCLDFKEKSIHLSEKSSLVEIKQDHVVGEEVLAIHLTEVLNEQHNSRPNRKLLDFIFHDINGVPQPFEMSEVEDLYITAIILPLDENSEKCKEKGVQCEGFGRIE